jgi:hypothetical protein
MNRKKSTHAGFGYRELQQENDRLRQQLTSENQAILKANRYRNVSWPNVIALFTKISNMIEIEDLAVSELDSLFLEVDRIGNKYQSSEEIQAFQAAMAFEAEAISEIIDRVFPDNEPEFIDFSAAKPQKQWRRSTQRKTYQKIKV